MQVGTCCLWRVFLITTVFVQMAAKQCKDSQKFPMTVSSGLQYGTQMVLIGEWQSGNRFSLDFKHGDDVLYSFIPRMREGIVVRNTKVIVFSE